MKTLKILALASAGAACMALPASAQTMTTTLSDIIYFDFNKSQQSNQTVAQLERIRDRVASCGQPQALSIVGHTDTSGSAAYNLGLSQRRAEFMKNELVKLGVPANIITTSGMGETQPFIPTADGVKEDLNRRTEILLNQDVLCTGQIIEQNQVYVEPEPVYVEPEPVYVEPEPVVVQEPAPVIKEPAPLVQEPAPVVAPEPAPVYDPTPVATGGGLAAPSVPLIVAGLGAVALAGIVIADDDDDDDDIPASP